MFKKINEKFKEKINKPLLYTSFAIFILILMWVVFFKGIGCFMPADKIVKTVNYMTNRNLIARFNHQFEEFNLKSSSFLSNLFLNVLIFIPFGFYLPLIFPENNILKNFFTCFCISLIIEIIQLITGLGGFEFVDLITNPLGFWVGYLIFLICKKGLTNIAVNYICMIIVVFALPFCIYGYTNAILNFHVFIPCFKIENYINLFSFN